MPELLSHPHAKVQPFELAEVRLLDGPFRDNLLRDQAYLLDLDADRLLHNFRVTAGLPSAAEPLGGWEAPDCELRGHMAGHVLSGLALMFAAQGDETLRDKADYLVEELAKCQDAMPSQGYKEGYLSAYPERQYDRWQKHQGVWAPYYVLHKIMAGLLDVHRFCDNRQALEVLERLTLWLGRRVDPLSPVLMQMALTNEPGGIAETLSDLFAVSGNPDHLELARQFNHEMLIDSLARGEDGLDYLHANTQIPKLIAAARLYELTGETALREAAEFFWHRLAEHRSWAIGGNSDAEFFFPIAETSRHLTAIAAETCNTYNMLKLSRHLFEWEAAAPVMEFYERALFNHILGSQDPDSGQTLYHASLRPGHFKLYSTPHDSFWCCTGTGVENPPRFGESIYFHDQNSLYVALFIASELQWREIGVTLRQETRFPDQENSTLIVSCAQPQSFTLQVRRPAWAAEGFAVTVNGEPAVADAPDSWVSLNREWHDGDRVEISLPMQLRFEPLPDDPTLVAPLYGPTVLAAELGTDDLPPNGQQANGVDHRSFWQDPVPPVPRLVAATFQAALSRIRRVKDRADQPLAFVTENLGQPHDLSLIPFFRLHHQRYAVYLRLLAEPELV